MKTTTLQIDDWVIYQSDKGPIPAIVTGLIDVKKYPHNCPIHLTLTEKATGNVRMTWLDEGQVIPMHLTEDMLSANLFVKGYDNVYSLEESDDEKIKIVYENDLSTLMIGDNTYFIRSVSDLQHILRVSGYSDIADKWRVK